MTSLQTREMIVLATAWIKTQTGSTPRGIFTDLRDMASSLLESNPPSQIPYIAPIDPTTRQVIDLGVDWLSKQNHLTPEQFLTQVRDGSIGYLNALPTPVPVGGNWRGCMFVPATAGMPNNHGVSSQLDYRGCHNTSNENVIRIDMLQCVKNWGGNWLSYIRGEFSRPNEVLDMALNGHQHPDGHYFPMKAPTATSGEVDWAMWAKETLGIEKHLCWIWNDNTSIPFTESIVAEAVASYKGSRLGMENIMFGVCLEDSEIMSVDLAVIMLGHMQKYAPQSPLVVGAADENFLMAVGARSPKVLVWFEQAAGGGSPVTVPLTRSTFPAFLATCNRLADKFGKARVIPGEWWASNPTDVKWMTEQLLAAGYTFLGSGKYT